jgi:hypothetical protein
MTFEFNLKGNRRGAISAITIAVFVSASLVFLIASAQNTIASPNMELSPNSYREGSQDPSRRIKSGQRLAIILA